MHLFLYASPFIRGIKNVKIDADCTVGTLHKSLYERHKPAFNRATIPLDDLVLVPLNPQVFIGPTQFQTEKDVYAAVQKLGDDYIVPNDDDLAVSAFNINDSHVVAYLRKVSEPSKNQANSGRPDDLDGPPVTLYHPVFAKLKDQLNNNTSTAVPNREELRLTHDLFNTASRLFASEDERMEQMVPLMEVLLGVKIVNKSRNRRSRSSGNSVTLVDLGDVSAVTAIMAWDSELGIGCEACLQALGLTYKKHVTQKLYEPIRSMSSCPCILFVFAGAHFCVFGAMITDIVVVQPFTEYILLGGTPDKTERVVHIARTFHALREALATLENEYRGLSFSDTVKAAARLFPNPTFLDSNQAPPNTGSLEYYSRISGNCRQPIFCAELNGNRTVIVKFSRSYNVEAHSLLAKAGLAPTLHFSAQVRGGYHMIVMDYLAKKNAYEVSKSTPLHPGVRQSVEKAIMLLHENGFVFGDLRLPNIMVDFNPPAAYLIDFDWAGREGQAKYPASINMSKDINWAPGVGRLRRSMICICSRTCSG